MRGPTFFRHPAPTLGCYFNPQAPCGARRAVQRQKVEVIIFQSTGPLRGPKLERPAEKEKIVYFNPQAPCGARLLAAQLPAECLLDFNPQAPCGARRLLPLSICQEVEISIHRPLAGPDAGRADDVAEEWIFQSTGPLRGPTAATGSRQQWFLISIHRPLAGPDAILSVD